MTLSIVPVYAGVLALFYVFLSFRVIGSRRSERVSLGDGGNASVQSRVRVHANFAEYVPFVLLLVAFLELQGIGPVQLHILCLLLVAGRLSHAYGVSQSPQIMPLRVVGMVMTFAALIGSAVRLLTLAV